ncbi:nucleotidyltransferase-like protein [Peribacillus asahii]|uniref:nucleotidyltransferase-like protein n=1 Tax=Peribacillus asahii TaxID=228899 RepID=UPI002079DB94|nr:nucleotidyltransferase-like protein [Peribacillus asahii]USK70892.1 nucleotidyltransferase-like protein [Peribacillus asahii]
MEDILRPIYQERASLQSTLGILLIEKSEDASLITDTFDYILFVIVNEAEDSVFVKHYMYKEKKAALHVVQEEQLKKWLLLGTNRKVVNWIQEGKILFDRNEYLKQLKTEIREFPFYGRKLKKGLEFAKLIRRYTDGRALFENGHFLDAFNHIVHSLHHLARLEVIEQGFYPEGTVWNQVKLIEPEIYKLYKELVSSEETLEKRLELLFLASEFLIHSRISIGSQHLLEIMETKEEPWTIAELMNHPELIHYTVDLSVLVEYLIEKHVIQSIKVETKGQGVFHRYYQT